jgi:alanyl-tRNA synthetase
VTAGEIAQAESAANRVVWEDRPVTIRFADASEAAALGLRKPSAREGVLRIIDVQDFDVSACGGTHVARTGAIGIIAVSSWERFRGGTRLEFVCGNRALETFRGLRDSAAAGTRLLSVLPLELPGAIERLQTDARESRRQLKALQLRLAAHEAAALADGAEMRGSTRVVLQSLDGWDANGLKAIASDIATRPGYAVLLFSAPAPAAVVIARAADVRLDCAAVLKQLTASFGGKGGGRPELAQGGGLQGSGTELVDAARQIVKPLLAS